MKHVGETIKNFIESSGLQKNEVARSAGISYNYLSSVFHKPTISCDLYERLCIAAGMPTSLVFESPEAASDTDSDSKVLELKKLLKEKEQLLAEKERTIQILMRVNPAFSGTSTEQAE